MSSIITVSKAGSDTRSATGSNVLFNATNPFAMLDTANTASFQNISIFFNNDPPFPGVAGTSIKTLIYSFPHGYTYTPQTWTLYQNNNGSGGGNLSYGYEDSVIASQPGLNFAYLHVEADATNINIYVLKVASLVPANPNIQAFTLKLRIYVFVEDIGI
jgi:hypothetical protein